MNAYWRMSTSGMEHLLNVGIFGNTKVLQEGVSRKNFFRGTLRGYGFIDDQAEREFLLGQIDVVN